MQVYSEGNYFLIDITEDSVFVDGPMTRIKLEEFIINKFQDQPLKYFNETNRLRIIHPKSGLQWAAKLGLQFG